MPTDEVVKAQAEEYLAELPDDEFAAVIRRVRPPNLPSTTATNEDTPAHQFASFFNQQLNGDPHE